MLAYCIYFNVDTKIHNWATDWCFLALERAGNFSNITTPSNPYHCYKSCTGAKVKSCKLKVLGLGGGQPGGGAGGGGQAGTEGR